jgi:hypothetical protein
MPEQRKTASEDVNVQSCGDCGNKFIDDESQPISLQEVPHIVN